MKGKMVSAIMLTLLLMSMLMLAFNIQPAKASGTIYIRADGSIDPPTAPISTADNVTYTFTDNIGDSIVVERDNIMVDGAGYTVTGSGNGNGITLTDRSNVTVKNMTTKNFDYGILLYSSSNNIVSDNNVTANSGYGIVLEHSSNNNVLSGNNVTANSAMYNGAGIYLDLSSNNTLSGNNVANNGVHTFGVLGICLYSSSNNIVSDNNVTANSGYGIFIGDFCNNNVLSGNNVANNEAGIYLGLSSNNTLSGNNGDGIWLGSSSDNALSGNNWSDIYLDSSFNNTLSGNNGGSIRLYSSSNNTLSGNNVASSWNGILLYSSSNNIVSDNNVTANSGYGISLTWLSNNNVLSGNNVANNGGGIWLEYSSNNIVSDNNVTANDGGGIGLYSSNNNVFYHNNFINNTQRVYVPTPGIANSWDDGYPSGGNYWSDYDGTDLYSGPQQNETGSDVIGDTPYIIDENNQDNYPLMKPYPWDPHDVGITSVTTSKNIVGQGFNMSINASVFNYGDSTENINVTIYANSTTISEINNIELASRNSTTITFTWNTTGFAMGNYTMTVYVTPVSGETDTTDNNSTGCWVLVTILGDVDGDFEDGHYDVDLFDAVKLLACYGAKEGDSNFDPNCDIDNDGRVFLFDAVILLSRYGQKYP